MKEASSPEIHISYLTKLEIPDPRTLPHRDENYVFVIQKAGYLILFVDGNIEEMRGSSVYFILPGQLRHYLELHSEVWILTVNASILQENLRLKLNEHYYRAVSAPISKIKAKRFDQCLSFLSEELVTPLYRFSNNIVRKGLIDVISGMVVEEYAISTSTEQGEHSRFSSITREFKELLLNNYKKMRKPGEYAHALSLSTPYLNQIIKSSTGYTVSYWIQKMIMNEARILLSSTLKPVKNIAHELGFSDQAYFSRLFSQTQGLSPMQYRLSTQETPSPDA